MRGGLKQKMLSVFVLETNFHTGTVKRHVMSRDTNCVTTKPIGILVAASNFIAVNKKTYNLSKSCP